MSLGDRFLHDFSDFLGSGGRWIWFFTHVMASGGRLLRDLSDFLRSRSCSGLAEGWLLPRCALWFIYPERTFGYWKPLIVSAVRGFRAS